MDIFTNMHKEPNNMCEKIDDTTELIENYIYTRTLNLNLHHLHDSCDKMYKLIKKSFVNNKMEHSGHTTLSTKLYASYNLLLYPLPGLHELFHEIKKLFNQVNTSEKSQHEKYYMQCWLNYYKKGQFIDWHGHWPAEQNTWHGYYCVDVEPSHTSYKLPDNDGNITVIHNKNNLLVLSPSDGDIHKSSEWMYDDRPRITIAFDIVPRQHLLYDVFLNHWIPV